MWCGAPKSPDSGASSAASRSCPSSADLVCMPSSSAPPGSDSVMTSPAPTAESSASPSSGASHRFVPSGSKPCSFESLVTSVRLRESKPAPSISLATVFPERQIDQGMLPAAVAEECVGVPDSLPGCLASLGGREPEVGERTSPQSSTLDVLTDELLTVCEDEMAVEEREDPR